MAANPATTERIEAQFLRFAGVGAIGFVVDASILTGLISGFAWGPYAARAVSFSAAVTVTWLLNRHHVFRPTSTPKREYSSYVVVQVVGALINLALYVLLIESLPQLAVWPVIPLAAGAVAGMVFNFFAARRYVFAAGD